MFHGASSSGLVRAVTACGVVLSLGACAPEDGGGVDVSEPDELVGQKRTRRLVTPRQVAMFLTRDLTDASLPAIGRAFGGRDHSTVLYAVQKISDQIKDEGEIYTAVTDLTTRLTGNA